MRKNLIESIKNDIQIQFYGPSEEDKASPDNLIVSKDKQFSSEEQRQ